MADEPTTPAVEAETPAVPETTPTEAPETPAETPETPVLTVEELQAQLTAERAKTAKAVRAEQAARTRAQTAETELTGFRTAAETAEQERVANLSWQQKYEEQVAAREAAEARAAKVEAESAERQLEADLGAAGFLSGLEGDAKAAQLAKLKALTGLDLVKQDGAFSIDAFSEHFGGLKPVVVATETVTAPTVIDLGGKTPPPTEQKASRKQELLDARKIGVDKGDRYAVMLIDGELSQLK